MQEGRGWEFRLGAGLEWRIVGGDAAGDLLADRVAGVMRLARASARGESFSLLRVRGCCPSSRSSPLAPGVALGAMTGSNDGTSASAAGSAECLVEPFASDGEMMARVISLSYVFSRAAEAGGGLLIHGALAEWSGMGVVLTGKSGVGKTTASGRLQAPWRSLSDDATLIVRTAPGRYEAHPWPTWSRIFDGEVGASWPVGEGVPLAGVYFICREGSERPVARPRPGAVVELLDLAYDTSWDVFRDVSREERRAIRLQLFDNAREIIAAVRCRSLLVTLRNAFWKEIEADISA